MIHRLQHLRPQAQFVLLGAPHEEPALDSLMTAASGKGCHLSKAVLSLEGAFSLLKGAQLLISGDTSIKHLANAAPIRILELSLGSSDLLRSGTYKPNSVILQPTIACAPCPHSVPCHKSAHECGDQLTPEMVAAAAHFHLEGNWPGLAKLAGERKDVRILRTRMTELGFWLADEILPSDAEKTIEKIVARCTWKFYLNRDYLQPVARFGTEGVHMKRSLEEILSMETVAGSGGFLDFLETEAGARRDRAALLLDSVRRRQPAVAEIQDFIETNDPQSRALKWMDQLNQGSEPGVAEIAGLRRVHNQLDQYFHQAQVKVKLIQSLRALLTESI